MNNTSDTKEVRYIYFSATSVTKKTMEALGATAENCINLTLPNTEAHLNGAPGSLLYIGYPVYGGRVPKLFLDRMDSLRFDNYNVVVVGTYGNRHYDDALDEMQAFVELRGGNVVATLAVVGEHCFVPQLATGRPDADDILKLNTISKEIEVKWHNGTLTPLAPTKPREYRAFPGVAFHPLTLDTCHQCGLCVKECPTVALSLTDDTILTDPSLCISCMRCVKLCPHNARQLPSPAQEALNTKLMVFAKEQKEIEVVWGE